MTRRRFTIKDLESDYEDPKPTDTRGKRKKRRVANSKDANGQQKSRALLQSMVDMPVDVLLEIFKHVELVDLMHLSRTSKALRSILMSRSSISVWKQVVVNDGLPPCTKDLNEPQLAELMFGRSCDWCGRNVSGQEIIWAARARACKRCIESKFELVNNHFMYNRNYPTCLSELLPSVTIKNKRYIDSELDREWSKEYLKGSSSKWLELLVEERSGIYQHAMACQEWFRSRRESIVSLRKTIIIERLKERGWEEELAKLSPNSRPRPTDLTEVAKACQSELTESTLASLDNVLDTFMEDVKAARLAREKKAFFKHKLEKLRDVLREYSHTLPPNHILPNTADIYFHPIVNGALSVVETQDDAALAEAVTGIQPLLPEIVDDCLKVSKQHLTDLVIDEYARNNKTFDLLVLTLATTLFQCRQCRRDITRDQAIVHSCPYYSNLSGDTEAVSIAIREVPTAYKIQHSFSFSLARLELLTSVLRSSGIDPDTTTVADMNEMDPIIECLGCSNIQRGRVTMRWLSVLNHFRHYNHPPTINVLLLAEPEAEIVRARLLEKYQMDNANSKDHICVHCRDTGGSMSLMQHVKQNHSIASPIYGQDVVVSIRAELSTREEFCLWPPRL